MKETEAGYGLQAFGVALAIHFGRENKSIRLMIDEFRAARDESVAAVSVQQALAMMASGRAENIVIAGNCRENHPVSVPIGIEQALKRGKCRDLAVVGIIAQKDNMPDLPPGNVVERSTQRLIAFIENACRANRICKPPRSHDAVLVSIPLKS